VEALARDAVAAAEMGDVNEAFVLLRQAIEREPDAPDLRNNYAAMLAAQGRMQEAEEQIRELHARRPDYLFGAANVARFHVRDRKLAEAQKLLEPLLQRPWMHFSEVRAVAESWIDLHLARKEREQARGWLQVLAAIDPDYPRLPSLRRRVRGRWWWPW